MKKTFIFGFLFMSMNLVFGSKKYDKIKLSNVQVLTLNINKMTTGRRGAPVPQLNCISNCNSLLPHVVQCTNQGWDGSSIQWECRADLETGYKFGELAVTCEGYEYIEDDYILAGSCGLEYSLISEKSSGKPSYGWHHDILGTSRKSGFAMQDLVALGACAIIIYALYKTCLGRSTHSNAQYSPTAGDAPPDDRQYPSTGWNIPSEGANQGAGFGMPGACGGQRWGGAAGGGGFWSGLATGGLMGYMFGNRGSSYQQRQYYDAPRNPTTGFFGRSEPSYSSSSYTSTRSATGFGSTRRR